MLFQYNKSKYPKHKFMVEMDQSKLYSSFGSSGWADGFTTWMNDNGFGIGEVYPYKRDDDLEWIYDSLLLHREAWTGRGAYPIWFKEEEKARQFDVLFGCKFPDSGALPWLQHNAKKWTII